MFFWCGADIRAVLDVPVTVKLLFKGRHTSQSVCVGRQYHRGSSKSQVQQSDIAASDEHRTAVVALYGQCGQSAGVRVNHAGTHEADIVENEGARQGA